MGKGIINIENQDSKKQYTCVAKEMQLRVRVCAIILKLTNKNNLS
jgi:hypothetical protein